MLCKNQNDNLKHYCISMNGIDANLEVEVGSSNDVLSSISTTSYSSFVAAFLKDSRKVNS